MVSTCARCDARQREIERLRNQRVADQQEIAELRAERDDLIARLSRSEEERDALVARLQENLRHRFGERSERQRGIASATEEAGSADGHAEDSDAGSPSTLAPRRRGQQSGRPGPRRRDYSELPTEEVVHDFEEPPRCRNCGLAYLAFGEERSEEIDVEVRIVRRIHRRTRYGRGCRCHDAAGVISPSPPPKVIPKGRFAVGFLARLVFYKYGLGLPLARIVALLEAEGAAFSPGSLIGCLDRVGKLLGPWADAIKAHNASSDHLHVDETSWKVFVMVPGKANYRHWIWAFVAKDSVAFYLKPSRGRDVVVDHLGLSADETGRLCLPDDRELLLSSDFYTTYQSLGHEVDGIVNLWCWAHARRYVLRCGEGHKDCRAWADAWLEEIRSLYRAWHTCCAAEAGSKEEAEALTACRRIVAEMDRTRRRQMKDDKLPAPAKKVLLTLDHEWSGLVAFLDYPGIDIDNNRAERHLRGPVVLRKGCYGSRSLAQARLAADAWTIVQTVALAGWNPLSVLQSYLLACAKAGAPLTEGELKAFLPWACPDDQARLFKSAPP